MPDLSVKVNQLKFTRPSVALNAQTNKEILLTLVCVIKREKLKNGNSLYKDGQVHGQTAVDFQKISNFDVQECTKVVPS